MPQNDIRIAIDEALSGVEHRPTLRYAILQKAQSQPGKHIRASLVPILALLFSLFAIGACAWAYISARQIAEETVVPMANEHLGSDFSAEDTAYLIRLAADNGIVLDEYAQGDLDKALLLDGGYSKQEMIMAFAKAEFGMDVRAWTPEEKYWYTQALASIGLTFDGGYTLPAEGELSEPQALELSASYLTALYGAELSLHDETLYQIHRSFVESSVPEPYTGRYWTIEYIPQTLTADQYTVDIDASGKVLGHTRLPGVREEMLRFQIEDRYEELYGKQNAWSQQIWRNYLEDVRKYAINHNNSDVGLMCIYHSAYPEVSPESISQETALSIAMNAVGATEENYMLDGVVYISCSPNPIWKVGLWVDPGTEHAKIYRIEIDSLTGDITHTYLCPDLGTRPPIYATHETWEEMEIFVQEWLDATAVG